ncbi:NAD(P)/FAD-dependent oxidoreductase [Sorangium sp. So ce1182]|uniref:NAD(P)/FAD-dependent oxidoreductase n=1 Tax=Sorangium sp. So ce1182 TaxID=3133334 RepID=UPI003F5E6C0A
MPRGAPPPGRSHGGLPAPADVLVLGGGPAGASAAIALRRRGLSALVVERAEGPGVRLGEHIAPPALPLLSRLGVLDGVLAGGHRRSAGVRSAWGEPVLRDRDYVFCAEGEGFHLSRAVFDAMLLEAAEGAGARVIRGAHPPPLVRRGPSGWVARVGGDELTFSVVVDATGRTASFARAQGARRRALDRLVGVAAFLAPRDALALDDALWIEAVEGGWLYSAPLAGDRLVVTLFADADALAAGGPAALAGALLAQSTHTAARVAPFSPAREWHVRPACSEVSDPIAGPGWLAVGDAATARDPLSSSGIAHALEDGIDAAAAIEAHLGGDARSFSRYAAARRLAFDDYLSMRTRYYRLEQRFPGSPFWRRRWWSSPEEAPVSLDPRARLRLAPRGMQRARSASPELPAGVDVEALCSAAEQGAPAHAIVAAYRAAHPAGASDRAVIVAVQALLERGIFETVG